MNWGSFDFLLSSPIRLNPKEGELYKPCLLALAWRPVRVETRVIKSSDTPGSILQIFVTEWAYFVYINLWLAELKFHWSAQAFKKVQLDKRNPWKYPAK